MATVAQVEQFRQGYDEIERLVRRDMRRIWTRLRKADPETIRNVLLELTPQLSDRYGAVAASMAAEWFEGITYQHAVLADLTVHQAVQASTRANAGGLWVGQREAAFNRIVASTVRHSLQPGRSTIARSAGRHGMYYARSPHPGACSWCLMLASRGAVYTAETVTTVVRGGVGGQAAGSRYHDECRCVPEPAHGRTLAGRNAELSYNVDALYARYKAAWFEDATDRDVAANMRRLYGLP